jgi:two-component sensor histidine kinase
VTNAFKHGFADGGSGTVRVRFSRLAERACRLEVVDDGQAAAAAGGPSSSPGGLGMQLVEGFVGQLRGTLLVDRSPCSRVRVDLPI